MAPTYAVFATAALFSVIAACAAYAVGVNGKQRFLKNYRAPSDYEAHIAFAMEYAQRSHEANDVVFLGDSTCLTGLDPVAFQQSSGLRAYNLSSMGVLGIDGLTVMLKHYLEHHPKPRMVVLCPHPWALSMPPVQLGAEDVREGYFRTYDPSSLLATPLTSAARIRLGFWKAYGFAIGGAGRFASTPIPHRNGETFASLGAKVKSRRGFWEQPGVLKKDQVAVDDLPLPVLVDVKEQVRALLRFASGRSVVTLIRLTPVSPGSASGSFAAIHGWLGEVAAMEPGVLVSVPDILHYAAIEFGEVRHLNAAGARRFTTFVAAEVTTKLGAR